MNLHLLPADNKLFVPKFAEMVINGPHAENNLLMCYVREMIVPSLRIPHATLHEVLSSIRHKSVNRIIFHSLQPEAVSLLKIVHKEAPECRMDWIYWGENYDDLTWLYDNQTLNEYIKARGFPSWVSLLMTKTRFAHALLRARNARFRHEASKYARHINTMFHWSRPDYEHIKMLLNCNDLRYKNFFYDTIDPQVVSSNLMEQELGCDPAECVVLGHSAAMRNNHLDVLPAVCEFALKRDKIVVCPLSYGETVKNYVDRIAKQMGKIPGLKYRLCHKFFPLEDYLSFLSKCGAYIAPGHGSIGAGNMISYARSGGIPVTAHKNSTGVFLKSLGAELAIYFNKADIAGILNRVFGTRSQINSTVASDVFSLKNKTKHYEELLQVVPIETITSSDFIQNIV